MARYQIQDPGETLSWQNDWTNYLISGQAISSRQWTINPDSSPSLLTNSTAAAVKVSSLTIGQKYVLTEAITTTDNQVVERSVVIRCEAR